MLSEAKRAPAADGTHLLAVGPALALRLALVSSPLVIRRGAELPLRLSDQEFWKLTADASEPGGYFRSQDITNLDFNELWFQFVIPDLVNAGAAGGGSISASGPSRITPTWPPFGRNWRSSSTSAAATSIFNSCTKAIFELAKDRADFVSMLFSLPRPAGVGVATSAQRLFAAFSTSTASGTLFKQNLAAIEDRLVKVHGFSLGAEDLSAIRTIYQTFFYSGFAVRASPTYADLHDGDRRVGHRPRLSGQRAGFAFLKDLQSRNLVVPVVGDFGGPKAIRAIGASSQEAERDRKCVLLVERRTNAVSGWEIGRLLSKRRDAAPRGFEHVHPRHERRPFWRFRPWRVVHDEPWRDARRSESLPSALRARVANPLARHAALVAILLALVSGPRSQWAATPPAEKWVTVWAALCPRSLSSGQSISPAGPAILIP